MKGQWSKLFVVLSVCLSIVAGCAAPPLPPSPTPTPQPVPLVVASVSMNARTDKAANLKEFERYMTDAAAQGAHLVVFPEVSLQQNPGWGFIWNRPTPEELAYVSDTAEPIPGESTRRLIEKAKEVGIYVIYGMTERGADGKLYNTSVFLGPEGVLESYRKNTLWDYGASGNEHLFWSRGTDRGTVVESPLGRIGLMICIEMAFDYGKDLDQKGADLLVTVSAWPVEGGHDYEGVTVQNARACDCWHVVADQVGKVGYGPDYGHSRIVDPSGKVVADTGSDEGMVIAETGLFIDPGGLPANRRP